MNKKKSLKKHYCVRLLIVIISLLLSTSLVMPIPSTISNMGKFIGTEPPGITINFAGNLSDQGGPAYQIGQGWPGPLIPDGYYTNDSRQHEDWIYINLTVVDEDGVDEVMLHWYDETEDEWVNDSYQFVFASENFWEFNSINTITNITSGHDYSFDIWAQDALGNEQIAPWQKIGLGGTTTRRYIQLSCTEESVTYTPYYVFDYTSGSGIYEIGDYGKSDVLHHDQGSALSYHDTGYLNSTLPGDNMQFRWCGGFFGLWFEDTVCIKPIKLRNIYYHFWWNTNDSAPGRIGWIKNRGVPSTLCDDYFSTEVLQSHSKTTYNNGIYNCSNNYNLSTYFLNITNAADFNFTDNDIYEICINMRGHHPSVICNRSRLSFVIFNVPDEYILQQNDTDGDGLTDYEELFCSYTSPFLQDTDNDQITDYDEFECGSDPNNYSMSYTIDDIPRIHFQTGDDERELIVQLDEGIGGRYSGDERLDVWVQDDVTPMEDIEMTLYVKGIHEQDWSLIKPMVYIRELIRGNLTAAEIEDFYTAGHTILEYKVAALDGDNHLSERPAPREETLFTITIENEKESSFLISGFHIAYIK